MDIRELRIGNYYIWKSEGKDYVYQVQPKDFEDGNYKNFYPIPLTEQWLLKFGFEQGINGLELSLEKDSDLGYVKIGCLFKQTTVTLEIAGNRMPIYDLKYVHQLQNLYFALTGKELQLSDNAIV